MAKKKYVNDYPGKWFRFYDEYIDSDAYMDLSPVSRSLLIEFARIYLPSTNGHLSISLTNAIKRLGVSKQTASNAFHELAEHGFLVLTNGELWMERKAREWRLTIMRCNDQDPTSEWKIWKPGKPVAVLAKKNHGPKF